MKVALVTMPWWRVEFMPVGVASLKSYLEAAGIETDCHHLNLRMYQRIGDLAKALPDDLILSEWFFAYHLFGPGGTGELSEELEDILNVASGHVTSAGRQSRADLEVLLHREIPAFLADCLENIPWSEYGLIGFSSLSASHTACLKLAQVIKARFPEIPIAFGGTNVEGEMGIAALKGCDWIDYVFDGEAEEGLLTLARSLREGKPPGDIPGVLQRRAGAILPSPPGKKTPVDVNLLSDPDHDDYFEQLARTGRPDADQHVTFEAARGCWWGEKQHCTFCGLNGGDMSFRAKPAESVANTILNLHRRYKCRHLHCTDDILAPNAFRELLPRLAELRQENGGLDWAIFFETKANLDDEKVAAMAAAGVTHIQPGIESLSSSVLRKVRKGVRAIENAQTLKLAQAHGIRASWNFLYGFPEETEADYGQALEMIPSLTHLEPPQVCGPLRLDRFSPYHFDWKKLGTGKPKPDPFYAFIYPPGRFAPDEIAYHFEFPAAPRTPRGLVEAVAFWQGLWTKNFFAYAVGSDFVEIHDSRPLSLGAAIQYRSSRLVGLEAELFRSCATIKSRDQLLAAAKTDDPSAGPARAAELLSELTRRRLLIEEDGLYLNPAVRESQLTAPQKIALANMELLFPKRACSLPN
ncbi:MAG: RiPP maturation radical SAM C-methyltransferase [Elusimicrobiota bacterium]